ncbi:MAG TPA: inositol monophosphatase family protein, partial [Acidimicrobiales bacterium]|nr:inositol monophosphatase family protein [Acidimicrobiales bacterium]
MDDSDDHALAARIAAEAGAMLVDLRARRGLADGRALGQEGDRLSNARIVGALHDARPDDAVRSEEQLDRPGRGGPAERRVWVVDPLDGTREYGEGRADFAVHVALW